MTNWISAFLRQPGAILKTPDDLVTVCEKVSWVMPTRIRSVPFDGFFGALSQISNQNVPGRRVTSDAEFSISQT
jgi:hypothetical protein